MYPSLLAQHPDLAAGMNAYRFQRLAEAQQHATATGYAGARFPWESALDGTEQIPPPTSVNSEGLYEQHITADIALAQWQYYLVTANKSWLAQQGWPVLSGAAAFWASRAHARQRRQVPHRRRHRTGRGEPERQRRGRTRTSARCARSRTPSRPPRCWGSLRRRAGRTIAADLAVPVDNALNIHPEFSGYGDQLVKQADVTLLQYPWGYAMPSKLARSDINYYVPRTDPGGPSMSDAVNLIDTAALGTAGLRELRVHRAQLSAVHPRRVPPVLRDEDRWRVHVHDRHRRVPAGVPVRLLGDALELGNVAAEPEPDRPDRRDRAARPAVARAATFTVDDRPAAHDRHAPERCAAADQDARGVRRSPRATRSCSHTPAGPDRLERPRPLRSASREQLAAGAPALAAVDGSSATDWEPTSVRSTLTARDRGPGLADPDRHAAVGTPVADGAGAERAAATDAGDRAPARRATRCSCRTTATAGAGSRS